MHRHNPQQGLIFVYHNDGATEGGNGNRFGSAGKKDFVLPAFWLRQMIETRPASIIWHWNQIGRA
jgi:hypothetical protein